MALITHKRFGYGNVEIQNKMEDKIFELMLKNSTIVDFNNEGEMPAINVEQFRDIAREIVKLFVNRSYCTAYSKQHQCNWYRSNNNACKTCSYKYDG